jgi:hypothetical protein
MDSTELALVRRSSWSWCEQRVPIAVWHDTTNERPAADTLSLEKFLIGFAVHQGTHPLFGSLVLFAFSLFRLPFRADAI